MQNHPYLIRTATLAIAATVALTPTPLLAQDAPAAETPHKIVTTAEPMVAGPEPTAAPVVAETKPTAPVTKPRAKSQAKTITAVAKPARARAETAVTAPAPPPLETQAIVPPLRVPIAEPTAATVESAMAMPNDDLERAAFAGILALLALGGAATAVSRHRRAHAALDRPIVHETAPPSPPPTMPAHRKPGKQAPSAFAWGRTAPAIPIGAGGGSWVDRARRGPTFDNPSLSLKKRLKRAAFYEQRERAVAAGLAKPLVRLAGLPERATENVRHGWTPRPNYTHALQPA